MYLPLERTSYQSSFPFVPSYVQTRLLGKGSTILALTLDTDSLLKGLKTFPYDSKFLWIDHGVLSEGHNSIKVVKRLAND